MNKQGKIIIAILLGLLVLGLSVVGYESYVQKSVTPFVTQVKPPFEKVVKQKSLLQSNKNGYSETMANNPKTFDTNLKELLSLTSTAKSLPKPPYGANQLYDNLKSFYDKEYLLMTELSQISSVNAISMDQVQNYVANVNKLTAELNKAKNANDVKKVQDKYATFEKNIDQSITNVNAVEVTTKEAESIKTNYLAILTMYKNGVHGRYGASGKIYTAIKNNSSSAYKTALKSYNSYMIDTKKYSEAYANITTSMQDWYVRHSVDFATVALLEVNVKQGLSKYDGTKK